MCLVCPDPQCAGLPEFRTERQLELHIEHHCYQIDQGYTHYNTEVVTELIEEVKFIDDSCYVGYIVRTNKQMFKFLLSNERICCEDWEVFIEYGDQITHQYQSANKDGVHYDANCCEELKGIEIQSFYTLHDSVYLETKDEKSICIGARVVHNGYYPHTLYLEWAGFVDSDDI